MDGIFFFYLLKITPHLAEYLPTYLSDYLLAGPYVPMHVLPKYSI